MSDPITCSVNCSSPRSDNPGTDLQKAKDLLLRENYSCVICHDTQTYVSREHGVKPLLSWIREESDFSGFSAADQVVGKAAALLYAKLGVRYLYTGMLSEKAVPVLERYHIETSADCTVPYIKNPRGDGICPMEQTVWDLENPEEAVRALIAKIQSFKSGHQ